MLLHFLLSQQLNSLPFVVKPHPFHISRWSQAIYQKLVQNKFAGTVRMKYKLKPARPRGKEGTCLFLKQSLCDTCVPFVQNSQISNIRYGVELRRGVGV